jgi:VWFA-related protein
MTRKLLALGMIATAVAFSQPKSAEIEEPDVVIRGGVDLVSVLASVRAKNGALIPNLEQKDFRVFEDGKEQEIRYFTRESNLPLTIGMLIDVSGSLEALIPVEQSAGGQFFEQVLGKQDLAFLISFGKDIELLQDSTGSPRLLQRGLRDLKVSTPPRMVTPGTVPSRQVGTALYDAVFLAADEKLRREAGRKVIVLITDGADYGSRTSLQKAIESAQKADAIIYGILYTDPRFGSDPGVLKRMSEETGGRMFEIGRNTSLDRIFTQIQEEMRTQYSISYAPTNSKRDGSYRKLELRPVNKDHKVQARKGYYAIEQE